MSQNNQPEKPRPAHLFKPGQSGNPGGKPKGWAEFSKRLATLDDDAFKAIKELLKHKDGKVRTMAVREFLDRRFGKAPIKLVDNDGNAMRIGIVILPPVDGEDSVDE